MERTLISRKDLEKRWGVTHKTIINYEKMGILTRNPNFPKPFYYLEEVQALDKYKPNPFSHVERKRLENENKKLKDRINALESVLSKVAMVGTESMNILTNFNYEIGGNLNG